MQTQSFAAALLDVLCHAFDIEATESAEVVHAGGLAVDGVPVLVGGNALPDAAEVHVLVGTVGLHRREELFEELLVAHFNAVLPGVSFLLNPQTQMLMCTCAVHAAMLEEPEPVAVRMIAAMIRAALELRTRYDLAPPPC